MRNLKARTSLAAVVLTCVAQLPLVVHNTASAASATVTGVVFEDKTSDGVRDGSDPGVAGVAVAAYDSTGARVGTATTDSNGSYTLTVTGAATTDLRVEFTTPTGFQSSIVGADNKTSIQFVSIGATNVSYGILNPDEYCANMFAAGKQPNGLAATCFQPPNAQTLPSVYMTGWNTRYSKKGAATSSETGAVWGLGYDPVRRLLWTSALVRRHAPVGPKKLCGVYATNPATGQVSLAFDLKADFGLDCGNDANFGATQSTTRDLSSTSYLSYDLPGWNQVGKLGFGDLDITTDGQNLFVVNLNDKKVYRFTIGGTTAAPTLTANGSWAVNSPCTVTGSVLRPWALKPLSATTVYVGSVCSNEGATVSATAAPESAVVQLMTITGTDTATWSTAATVNLDYVRGCPHGYDCSPAQNGLSKWKAWTNNFNGIFGLNLSGKLVYPEPILSDIEILDDGSMVVGLMDRLSMQTGWNNLTPDSAKTNGLLIQAAVDGDTLLFCKQGSSFVQESDGACSSDTVNYAAPARVYARENSSSPNKEFFDDNYDDGDGNSIHPEMSQGGLAVLRGSNEIAISMMDPDDWINQGGIRFLSQTTGSKGGYPYAIVLASDKVANDAGVSGSDVSFSKSATLGDLEVLCDNAPVQIGNRLWKDLNANGIQDPGEPGIAGVTIKLFRASDGWQWGTVVTDANGNYYFSSNVTERWQGNGDSVGGGLVPDEPFYLKMDNNADYLSGGPLFGYTVTRATASSAASALDTSIDSNAYIQGWGDWRADIAAVAPGNNNHTYDIGVVPTATLGNLVFADTNGNGVQDAGETGIAGAVLTLTDMSGNPVTNVLGQPVGPITTSSTGSYLFDKLPLGQYKVSIAYPAGYGPTVPGQGTSTNDSSAFTATSAALTAAGLDTSLDFGVVPVVSVGDYVWYDVNHDGIQDATDVPLQGVTLTLTKADGSPAYNSMGELVTTTTTDANGKYSFDNLPFGQYKVTVTPPAGYVATTTGAGTSATDSSTGSETSVVLNTAGQRDSTLDFGFWGEVSVGDYVWYDVNHDGIQDATDIPLQGVTLTLTKADGSPAYNTSGALVTTTTTDANGKYSFDNLPFGQYKVTVTPPAGMVPTVAGAGSSSSDSSTGSATSVVLNTNGQRDPTLDFGFWGEVSVGDYVWFDKNGDGVQDSTDVPLAGVTLTLTKADGSPAYNTSGQLVTTTKTDSKGKYSFDNLPFGQYKVTVTPPAGYVATKTGAGTSATDSSTGSETSVVLNTNGQRDPTLDFGFVKDGATVSPTDSGRPPQVSIGDRVWRDRNGDGLQGPEDVGLKGAILSVFNIDGSRVRNVDGKIVKSITTDKTGYYRFTGLPPGRYVVKITYPTGWRPTTPNREQRGRNSSSFQVRSRNLAAGQHDPTLDFGVVSVKGAAGLPVTK